MPPIDWIHVAMFVAGLVLQYVTSRTGGTPVNPPTPLPLSVPTSEAKPLLDLVHKLLDQRQPAAPPPLDPQSIETWLGVVNKLLDQPKPAPSAKS